MATWMRDDDDRARSTNQFQMRSGYSAPMRRTGGGLLGFFAARGRLLFIIALALIAIYIVGSRGSDTAESGAPVVEEDPLVTEVRESLARAGLSSVRVGLDEFSIVLTGEVANNADRVAAEAVALSNAAVITVDNQLIVPEGADDAAASVDLTGAGTGLSTEDFQLQARLSVLASSNRIEFESASDQIVSETLPTLDQIATLLLENPTVNIEIGGHTDSDGDPAANMTLSENRARAVQTYLSSLGVPFERMAIVGYGDTQPIADNVTQEGKALNRRIEFLVQP